MIIREGNKKRLSGNITKQNTKKRILIVVKDLNFKIKIERSGENEIRKMIISSDI